MFKRQIRSVIPVFLAMLLQVACGHSEPAEPEPLIGLWAWTAEETPSEIDVDVQRKGDQWTAQVGDHAAPVTVKRDEVTVELPDAHRFIGQLTQDGSRIDGRWFQPPNALGYSEMVTLASLHLTEDERWTGRISSQARPFRVFLDVFETEAGQLAAVVRNPERNEIMRATRFAVEPEGLNEWALVAGEGDREARHAFKLINGDLHLVHTWFGETLALERTEIEDAHGYKSRTESEKTEPYLAPPDLGDGWPVTTPEDAGFDRDLLDALVKELATSDPRSARPRLIHSVLVAHQGELLMEEYFYGYDRDTTHDTRSLGKVFAPVLIGALQNKGFDIGSDDRPIPRLLAAAGEPLDEPKKANITLAHLMSFSSGLDCDVNRDSPGSEDRMWEQTQESDFWLYTSRLPLLHEPGTRYAYCSGSINLVGAALREVGKKPIIELFDDLIAKPLGFGPYQWNLAPNGAAYLGGGSYMRPRDILKIGALYASGGRWNGEQIINPDWIEESTTTLIEITPGTTGMTPEDFSNSYFGGGAAYEWRVDQVNAGDRTYRSYEATGNGGQMLIVVPELELSVLLMGGNYRQGGIWGRWRNEIVGDFIIPAMGR